MTYFLGKIKSHERIVEKQFKQISNSNTITGLSEKAEGILSKALELWPILQRPFARDPVDDAIETDGFRGKKISDLYLPY